MSSTREAPHWYRHGDVPATVREAREVGADETHLVDVLAEYEFDAEPARVRELVRELEPYDGEVPESVATVSDGDHGSAPTRRLAVSDVEYFDRREFARVLGAVLTRYEGTFSVPSPDADLAVDLFWNRQYGTVGLRTEPRGTSTTVGDEPVHSLADGATDPLVGRSPTELVVVSNRSFDPVAATTATEADDSIRLVGPETLRRWFTDAKLSREVVGELVDAAGLTDEQFSDLVADIGRVPKSRCPEDPLSVGGEPTRTDEVSTGDGDSADEASDSDEMERQGSAGAETTERDAEASATVDRRQTDPDADGTDVSEGAGPDAAAEGNREDESTVVSADPSECGVLYDTSEDAADDDEAVVDDFLDGLGGEGQ